MALKYHLFIAANFLKGKAKRFSSTLKAYEVASFHSQKIFRKEEKRKWLLLEHSVLLW